MNGLLNDIRYAFRLLARDKIFTAAALLTLALCIGANTAVFSVLNGVVLRPLAFEDPDQLVVTTNRYPRVYEGPSQNSATDFFDRREKVPSFAAVGIFRQRDFVVGEPGSPVQVSGLEVTPSMLDVLRIRPILGRNFTEGEMEEGAEWVALVTFGYWKEVLGGDPEMIGQAIQLSGRDVTVVGVLPRDLDFARDARVWVCGQYSPKQRGAEGLHSNSFGMLARLAPGANLTAARRDLDALNEANLARIPELADLISETGYFTEVTLYADYLLRDVRAALVFLQIGVLLVLVIGCVNVANLLLSRSTGRVKELAVRFALGAGNWRVTRQLLVESMVLSVAGGFLGLIVGVWGISAVQALGADQLPRADGITLNRAVLGFTVLVSLLTGLVFGLIPAAHILRSNLRDLFQQTSRTGSQGPSGVFLRNILVVIQVALAFILVVGAGLLMRSYLVLTSVDPGFRYEAVETGKLTLSNTSYPEPEDRAVFVDRLLNRLRALPGMEAVSIAGMMPFGGEHNSSAISAEGYEVSAAQLPPVANWFWVDGTYFSTMGIPLVDGRTFGPEDTMASTPVVMIDRALAEQFWPGQDPLGRVLYDGVDEDDRKACTVVGLVDSVKVFGLDDAASRGDLYFSIRQDPQNDFYLTYKSNLAEGSIHESVRSAILDLDPELPLTDVRSLRSRIDESLNGRRTPMVLLQTFGIVALVLAGIGVYGVLCYSVSQRRREIGIRMALGASVRQIGLMVLRSGVAMVLTGLVLGALGAYGLTRFLDSLLFGVQSLDAASFIGAAFVMACIGMLACFLPALRATRTDPLLLLREE